MPNPDGLIRLIIVSGDVRIFENFALQQYLVDHSRPTIGRAKQNSPGIYEIGFRRTDERGIRRINLDGAALCPTLGRQSTRETRD
jgi:hypothetical protein